VLLQYKGALEFYTHLKTAQLSNSVLNVNEKIYKAGFKRLIPDKVLNPYGNVRFGLYFFKIIVFQIS
jgi:hypothetical protein